MRKAMIALGLVLSAAGPALAAPAPKGQVVAASKLDLMALGVQATANLQRGLNEQEVKRKIDKATGDARDDAQAREIADLKEAVRKLTQQAQAGDKSSGQALQSFAENKLGAGLDAVEAGARAATTDAAARWRQAGALANGVNTARALNAYEKAFALDPGDFWTSVYVARLRDEAGNVQGALAAARAAEAAAKKERDRGVAAHEVGVRLQKMGDLSGARAAFQRYADASEKLAAANPGTAEAQRDVSVSLEKLGNVAVEAGDLAGAKTAYTRSLALAEKLAAANAASAQAQRDLSVVLNKLGDVAVKAGDLVGAKAAYTRSLALAEKLAAANPASAEAQRDVSVSLGKLGDVAVAAGDLAGAKDYYTRSSTVLEKLAAANPASAQAQRDVWVSMWKLAGMQGGGVTWAQVLTRMEAMKARGVLLPTDEQFLTQARAKAAQ